MHFFKDLTKDKIKAWFKKILLLIFNPRLLLCLAIAWMITNGWSYIFIAVGGFFKIDWMLWIGGVYGGILWFPFTPEKIVTVAIAIFLLRVFFPKDEKTLGVLREMLHSAKEKHLEAKEKRKQKREERKQKKEDENPSENTEK